MDNLYDLTPLLTCIASCSGTFTAIVGGFIVRKLISMSQERHTLEAQIAQAKGEAKKIGTLITAHGFNQSDPHPTNFFQEPSQINLNKLEKLDREVEEVEHRQFRIKLLNQRLEDLKNPRGMKRGLLVFVVFSIFGVLLPMTLTPFKTDSYPLYLTVKTTVIFLFAGCLLFAYSYFLYLLRWRNKDVVSRWMEYIAPDPRESVSETKDTHNFPIDKNAPKGKMKP